MKLKEHNTYKILVFIWINILIIFKNTTHANNQKIEIYSTSQAIDILSNTISFEDHVILKYKNIKLFADKIIIIHDKNKHNITMMKVYGNPIHINYIQKSGYTTLIQSEKINYNATDHRIILNGNARIEQSGNSICSDNIIYYIKQKKIQATSKKNKKTTTILIKDPN